MTGYLHPEYAGSLSEFGIPRELPECGGWVLEREIPCSAYRDAMGCYPLFACRNWSGLHRDLNNTSDLISVALVTDPFGAFELQDLQQAFDVAIPFKEHFVADLSQPVNSIVSQHHRQYSRKYSRDVDVLVCPNPPDFCDDWLNLYAHLIERHHIEDMRTFSKNIFLKQLHLPGVLVLKAQYLNEVIGAQLWLKQGDVCYSHLTACSSKGYDKGAAYALNWFAVHYFKESGDIHWLDIGAGPGLKGDSGGGLMQFKRGWANDKRTAYFCGKIFDKERYHEITAAAGVGETSYFPAYRAGEFGQQIDDAQ